MTTLLRMPVSLERKTDPWPEERQGYDQQTPVAYVPVHNEEVEDDGQAIRRAEQIGSLVAGAGIIWTVYAFSQHSAEIVRFAVWPPGPLEVLGVGILIWLCAKWCWAVKPH